MSLPRSGQVYFTRRQAQVVALLARGLDEPAIAAKLGLSYHTVRIHSKAARARVGARSHAELVFQAYRRGLLNP